MPGNDPSKSGKKKPFRKPEPSKPPELIRLNRFIANAGVCSRRDADELIRKGEIKVNGKVVTELGSKVKRSDKIEYRGKKLTSEVKQYVLLNKPKDFITTVEDPKERKTVMSLVSNACRERIYPVGRLDRHTTGLLLFSNDGDLAKRLTHPSYKVRKIYQVELSKRLTPEDFEKIVSGVTLEDGPAPVDELAVVDEKGKTIGLEIHIGKNRIVRRIFEHLGYDILRLDRVMFGPLTKKDLSRGKWRHLTQKEVSALYRLTGIK